MAWPRNPGQVSSGFGFAAAIDDVTNSVTNSSSDSVIHAFEYNSPPGGRTARP